MNIKDKARNILDYHLDNSGEVVNFHNREMYKVALKAVEDALTPPKKEQKG